MHGTNRKWAALFFFLIALPVGALTYLSASSFQDEQRAALTEINLLVPGLQRALDRQVDALASSALTAAIPPPGPDAQPDIAGIVHIFLLDDAGYLTYPRYRPAVLVDREPAHADLMLRGERLEFQTRDLAGAFATYEAALNQTLIAEQSREALNGMGRVAVRQGRLEKALELHRRLQPKDEDGRPLDGLDPDGTHPLSLSYLRLAGRLPAERAAALLDEWVSALLTGDAHLFPGTHHLLAQADERRRTLADSGGVVPHLDDRIAQARQLADHIAAYNDLSASGLLTGGVQSLSGIGVDGRDYLLHIRPGDDGPTRAVFFDLETLAGQVMLASAAGIELRNQGFALEFFDVDHTDRFDLKHRDGTHMVVPASRSAYRLNMGIFAADEAFVLQNYRNRNLFTTLGIFLLAGTIAGGAYLIFRDTGRQIQTARLRAEFVANVSHELRTPLTSIRMYAETLRLGRYRDPQQLQDYLDTIMQESQRLSRMVGNVLDFSRMESGRKTYDFEALDLGELVRRTVEEFGPLLEEGGFALEIQIDDGLPPVRADAEALSTAVANLMSNAIKYSGEHREVAVSVGRDDEMVWVEVADRGIGVPPAERERIFEKFHRAAGAGDTATGTGLGLALVKGVVEAHGGAIAYRPRAGGGSTFTIQLTES